MNNRPQHEYNEEDLEELLTEIMRDSRRQHIKEMRDLKKKIKIYEDLITSENEADRALAEKMYDEMEREMVLDEYDSRFNNFDHI